MATFLRDYEFQTEAGDYFNPGRMRLDFIATDYEDFRRFHNSIKDMGINTDLADLFPGSVIVKCQHCGQWCARKTACKYCGAPVD